MQTVLNQIASHLGGFFKPTGSILLSRAPARLDVMGGIADYSGSLVLEGTLARAAHVAVQRRCDRTLRALTVGVAEMQQTVELSLDDLYGSGGVKSYAQFCRLFTSAHTRWAGYVLGGLHVLLKERVVTAWPGGLDLMVSSDIPMGAGVASSAAIEVAAMNAIAAAYGLALDGLQLARLCQLVENRVVGAPCGIMDQVTAAVGQPRRLLALLCQPCEIAGHYAVPRGYRFVAINSGIRHSIGGQAYGRVRAAAFMGHTMAASHGVLPAGPYWCQISPQHFTEHCERLLPEKMTGAEFLQHYRQTADTVTSVQPDMTYPVRQASRHPVCENARVHRFAELLRDGSETAMVEAGQLMMQSHDSYSACGLGSDQTDLLVKLVRERGPAEGLYGAKITGGGSGGTVAVLAAQGAADAIRDLTRQYRARTGIAPAILSGSTEGAVQWGVRQIQ